MALGLQKYCIANKRCGVLCLQNLANKISRFTCFASNLEQTATNLPLQSVAP